jgi:hypothetical protein
MTPVVFYLLMLWEELRAEFIVSLSDGMAWLQKHLESCSHVKVMVNKLEKGW